MDALQKIAVNQLPNTLGDAPVMTKTDFAEQARNAAAPLRFATSQSAVPAPFARPEHVARVCADALRVSGITSNAVHLNLAAPPPHSSGWAANQGFSGIGATSLNRHFSDLDHLMTDEAAETATVLSSIPGKIIDLADDIETTHGSPHSIFPNLTTGIFTGQLLRPSVRTAAKSRWGLETTREFYGSSEATLVAAAPDESRRMVPLLNRHILEIESDDGIIDIREISEPTEGSLVITDPARTAVTLQRYRQGDHVRIYPGDPLPRLTPLGRSDDAIDIDGALLHPADLFDSIGAVYGDETDAIAYVHDTADPTTIEVFVEHTTDPRTEELYEALLDRQPALHHAIGERPGNRITITPVTDLLELDVGDSNELKPQMIIFESDSP